MSNVFSTVPLLKLRYTCSFMLLPIYLCCFNMFSSNSFNGSLPVSLIQILAAKGNLISFNVMRKAKVGMKEYQLGKFANDQSLIYNAVLDARNVLSLQ
ncbi:hypothetical protein P8452_03815 [Trifolium repens]|nr:hypothetical protein P8452_03815 [Trifolium repens]